MELEPDRTMLEEAAAAACRAGLRAGLRESDARDLGQEALLRALSTTRPPVGVSLAAWAYGIAKNLGRDHAKVRVRELLVDAPPEVSGDDEDLALVLSVRRALHELPEPLRDVVMLHELEECSLRETAAALAIPFDTAKDRLRRGREQLRQLLADSDTAYERERSYSRRRAAVSSAAIVVAVWTTINEPAASAAASSIAVASGRHVVRGWVATFAGSALIAGGFAIGRLTASAPTHPPIVAVPTVSHRNEDVASPSEHREPPVSPNALPAHRAPSRQIAAPPQTTGSGTEQSPDHAAEQLVLERARAALQRGLVDEALVALMSHARQFPTGVLVEEREVMLIEAYLRANNTELARRRLVHYLGTFPTGALRARVDALAAQIAN